MGSKEDFSESEEAETFYDSHQEQTESEDKEIPRQETDPTIQSKIICQITQSIPEAAKPVKIASNKRKLRRSQEKPRKFLRFQKK